MSLCSKHTRAHSFCFFNFPLVTIAIAITIVVFIFLHIEHINSLFFF